MNWKAYCYICIGAIIQAVGVALLKSELGAHKEGIIIGAALFLMMIGFPLYNMGLKETRFSVAQPLFSTTLFITSTLLSIFALHEMIKTHQIIGIVMILLGVFTVIFNGDNQIIVRRKD